jgi:hypothetical protein
MTAAAYVSRRFANLPPTEWAAVGAIGAIGLGALATVDSTLAVAAVIVLALLLVVSQHTAAILSILGATVFVEMIRIGDLRITRVIAPVALLILVGYLIQRGGKLRADPPLLWALAYATWALASGLWTEDLSGTLFLQGSLAISLVYMFSFAILLTRRDLERILVVFAICSVLVGISSTAAFTGHHIPLLGNAELQGGRAQGATGDPSFFAAFQLIVLPLLLVRALIKQGWRRYALFGVVGINVASVLSTVSRGGVLQLVALFLFLAAWPAKRLFASQRQKIAVLLIVAVSGGVFFVHYQRDIQPRLATIFQQGKGGKSDTGSGRLIIWPAAWEAFSHHPYTGIGYGAFLPQSLDRMFATHGTDFGNFQPIPQEPHNTFLGALAELGVPGLVFLLGLLGATILQFHRVAARARAARDYELMRYSNALAVGIVPWCVGVFWISAETSRPIWIVIGFALAFPNLIERRADVPGSSEAARSP